MVDDRRMNSLRWLASTHQGHSIATGRGHITHMTQVPTAQIRKTSLSSDGPQASEILSMTVYKCAIIHKQTFHTLYQIGYVLKH